MPVLSLAPTQTSPLLESFLKQDRLHEVILLSFYTKVNQSMIDPIKAPTFCSRCHKLRS